MRQREGEPDLLADEKMEFLIFLLIILLAFSYAVSLILVTLFPTYDTISLLTISPLMI